MQTLYLLIVCHAVIRGEIILFLAPVFKTQQGWLRGKSGPHLPYVVRVPEATVLLPLSSVLLASLSVSASHVGVGLAVATVR